MTRRVSVEITWKSILRLLVAALVIHAAIRLWPLFRLLVLAILIAVAAYPIVKWAGRRGWPRWIGLVLATATVLLVVIGCFAVIAPIVFHQLGTLGENLPRLREQIMQQLPPSGVVRQSLERSINPNTVADSRLVLERMLLVIKSTLGGLVYFVGVVALAVYLIIDGPKAIRWLIVFFPVAQRGKLSAALAEMSRLVSAYVAGQFVVSAFAAAYLFMVLKLLGVPMALLLGIVAGICDILPVVGFFVSVLTAMAMGLSVSSGTALLIFVVYGAYHLLENFYIVPKVYGRKLKLSKLAVPLAVAAGGVLAGVVGAIAVLPIVAAYPVVERHWLAGRLEPDTIKEHEGGGT